MLGLFQINKSKTFLGASSPVPDPTLWWGHSLRPVEGDTPLPAHHLFAARAPSR